MPAACCAYNWPFQLQDLLAQPLLLRDWLHPFAAQIEALLATPQDIIGQGSLLWNMIYHSVDQMKQALPAGRLIVVRHEDLSVEPVQNFRSLYNQLGLVFDARVERAILQSSSADNPQEAVRYPKRKNLFFDKNMVPRKNSHIAQIWVFYLIRTKSGEHKVFFAWFGEEEISSFLIGLYFWRKKRMK